MKTTLSFPTILMLIGILFLEGCLEIDVRTKISADGSSERIITLIRDSESIPDAAFPIPVDPSWTTEWKKSGKDSSKYEYTARRDFDSPEELSREYSSRPDTSLLQIHVGIEKRFEWFYSYLKYSETYDLDNPFGKIPISAVLTEADIETYRRGAEDDSIKAKVDKWFLQNIFEEFFTGAVMILENKNIPSLPASKLSEKKDYMLNLAMDDSIQMENADDLMKFLEKMMDTKEIHSLKNEFTVLWTSIEAKSQRLSRADGSYTNSVELPGLLLETNSGKIEGSRITWQFTSDQLRVGKYEMNAESRVTNVWAFMVTGLVGLFIIIVIAILLRRGSHNRPV